MFSYSGLGFSILTCYEEKYFEKEKSIILLKKSMENFIFKIIQVIFKQY